MRFQVVPAAYVLLCRTHTSGRDEVLLQLRQNTGYRDGCWATAAAGHVEAGESVVDAALRETREELDVVPLDLQPLTTLHRTDGTDDPVEQRVDFFFTCHQWAGEPRVVEPHKCAGLRWFALDDLPDTLAPTERHVLTRLHAGDLPAIDVLGF